MSSKGRWKKRRVHEESLEHDKFEMLDEIMDKLDRLEDDLKAIKEKLDELTAPEP